MRFLSLFTTLALSLSSVSAYASNHPTHWVKNATIMKNVTVVPVNGGFNPNARAYKVTAQVLLGKNTCFAQSLEGSILDQDSNGNPQIVAFASGNQPKHMNCSDEWKPVYVTISMVIRGDSDLAYTYHLQNVEQYGVQKPLADFLSE